MKNIGHTRSFSQLIPLGFLEYYFQLIGMYLCYWDLPYWQTEPYESPLVISSVCSRSVKLHKIRAS